MLKLELPGATTPKSSTSKANPQGEESREAQMTIPRDRVKFSAIVDRPKLSSPRQAHRRVDHRQSRSLGYRKPMARQVLPAPTGVPLLPDVPNWSWHEYGMRVLLRFHALYGRLKIRPTVAINCARVRDYPRVAQACKDAGWEFMGHSYEQGPIHNEKDQPAMIQRHSTRSRSSPASAASAAGRTHRDLRDAGALAAAA